MKIEVLEVSMVNPMSSTTGSFLPLTQFDTRYLFHPYMQMVAFYPAPPFTEHPDTNSSILHAKNSLSAVLVHFHPMAGRLHFSVHHNMWGINCNNAGVEWTFAMADITLTKLDYSQPSPQMSNLICNGKYGVPVPLGSPLLSIQVTKFLCGGISVAWAADHILGDGTGRVHFLISWAETCLTGKVSQLPFIDRHLVADFVHPPTKVISPPSDIQQNPIESAIIVKAFLFDKEYLTTLRHQAGEGFSSFVLLSAHIWINMCVARDLPDSHTTLNSIAANCRKRLVPQLPEQYLGNAVLHPVARASAGELRKGGLQYAAGLVKSSILDLDVEAIKQKLSGSQGIAADSLGKNSNILCSSSPRFKYYEIDLGWGRPTAVRHVGLEKLALDGLCMFNPSARSPQEIEVTISLPLETMNRLTNPLSCSEK